MLALTGDCVSFSGSVFCTSTIFYHMLHLSFFFSRNALLINVYVSMVLVLRSLCNGDEITNIANGNASHLQNVEKSGRILSDLRNLQNKNMIKWLYRISNSDTVVNTKHHKNCHLLLGCLARTVISQGSPAEIVKNKTDSAIQQVFLRKQNFRLQCKDRFQN